MDSLKAKDVQEGDFFILNPSLGYRGLQLQDAMQVMECWPEVMTVKTDGGCMVKPYDHFVKVEDISDFKKIHKSPYFEDNRKKEVSNG